MIALRRFVNVPVVVLNCFVEQIAGLSASATGAKKFVSARLRMSELYWQEEQQHPTMDYSQGPPTLHLFDWQSSICQKLNR